MVKHKLTIELEFEDGYAIEPLDTKIYLDGDHSNGIQSLFLYADAHGGGVKLGITQIKIHSGIEPFELIQNTPSYYYEQSGRPYTDSPETTQKQFKRISEDIINNYIIQNIIE